MATQPRSRMYFSIFITAVLIFGVALPQVLMGIESYSQIRNSWRPYDLQYLVHPAFRMTLVLIAWLIIRHQASPHQHPRLGLLVGLKRAMIGFGVGFGCALPMLLLGLFASVRDEFNPRYIAYTTLMPGLTEEVFYRAFAFGLLVQLARWRLWPAAIFTGIVFGLAHVDFSPDPGETILGQLGPWIAMIGVGGVMYAWLYERAAWNLWPVIALHFAMNLWWDIFDLNSSPLGVAGATATRVLSIGLAVYFVVLVGLLPKDPALRSMDEHTERKTEPEHD